MANCRSPNTRLAKEKRGETSRSIISIAEHMSRDSTGSGLSKSQVAAHLQRQRLLKVPEDLLRLRSDVVQEQSGMLVLFSS